MGEDGENEILVPPFMHLTHILLFVLALNIK